MLDIAPTELLLVALVALIVIGPKDLPRVLRVVGQWVGRARGVARHFRSGFDEMVRQAEFEEIEKKWAAENERIMREHPPHADAAHPDPTPPASSHADIARREVDSAVDSFSGTTDGGAVMMPLPLPESPAVETPAPDETQPRP